MRIIRVERTSVENKMGKNKWGWDMEAVGRFSKRKTKYIKVYLY